jgi:hypothetical protein
MALELPRPIAEIITRKIHGGRRWINHSAVGRMSRESEGLDVSQPYGPPRLITGIVLRFLAVNR